MGNWLATNWFPLIESAGIMASLLLSAMAFRTSSKVRQTEVTLALAGAHREIWRMLQADDSLSRILDPKADIEKTPPTPGEEGFVLSVMHHLSAGVQAIQEGSISLPVGFEADIREFFSFPVPKAVAAAALPYQSPAFQRFLKRCIK